VIRFEASTCETYRHREISRHGERNKAAKNAPCLNGVRGARVISSKSEQLFLFRIKRITQAVLSVEVLLRDTLDLGGGDKRDQLLGIREAGERSWWFSAI
jgi:hypothetical protein